MDWGFKTAGHILWFTMDEDENLIVIAELGFQLKLVSQVAEDVKRVELRLGCWDRTRDRSTITGPADTQLWERRGDTAKSKAEEFAELGVPWVQANKSEGSRRNNAQRISTRLLDHDNGTVDPGLCFFSTCQMVIRCIQSIGAEPHHPEEPRKGGKDHPYDALAYGVDFASHGLKGISKPKRAPLSHIDDRSRGQYGYGQH
jgi:hypothetical protein